MSDQLFVPDAVGSEAAQVAGQGATLAGIAGLLRSAEARGAAACGSSISSSALHGALRVWASAIDATARGVSSEASGLHAAYAAYHETDGGGGGW